MQRGHKNSQCDLTYEFVREVFWYKPKTGKLFWKKRLSKRIHIGDEAGYLNAERLKVGISNKEYMIHRIIWLYQTGKWPKFEIDHKNGIKNDNRWRNLREATSPQNQRNRRLQRNNTTGYKGVCEHRPGSFIVGIKFNGKRQHLGVFQTAKEAYAVYCAAAKKYDKKFWRVN